MVSVIEYIHCPINKASLPYFSNKKSKRKNDNFFLFSSDRGHVMWCLCYDMIWLKYLWRIKLISILCYIHLLFNLCKLINSCCLLIFCLWVFVSKKNWDIIRFIRSNRDISRHLVWNCRNCTICICPFIFVIS